MCVYAHAPLPPHTYKKKGRTVQQVASEAGVVRTAASQARPVLPPSTRLGEEPHAHSWSKGAGPAPCFYPLACQDPEITHLLSEILLETSQPVGRVATAMEKE